jgi:hypothetical protein
VCGWTRENSELRLQITRAIDADIISLCETHLSNQDVINVPGYVWYGFNRPEIHRNAPKASGGVGLLVKKMDFYGI